MSFINNRFFQFLCVFLIGYSLVGGLLVPLSPNIEQLNYKESETELVVDIKTPKLSESLSEIYLKKVSLGDTSADLIFPTKIEKKVDGYQFIFPHPKLYSNFEKGNNLDLICQTETWGDLRYFSAFYIDSVVGNTALVHTKKIAQKEKQFHLSFPNRTILNETIRNLFFHVPMWFAMIGLLTYSLVQSILFLSKNQLQSDLKASMGARVGMIFGILGILTGMVWAKYTWGAFWTNDPKLNGAAIGMLAYLAYFILRGSIEDEIKKAKLSAVYNIFSYTIYMVFIMVLPRINDSLHPGNGGNPGFNIYEQDNVMRLFFYPAVIGWGMLGFWLTELYVKIHSQKNDLN